MASGEPCEGASEEAGGRGRCGDGVRRHVHDQVSEFLGGLEIQSVAPCGAFRGGLEGDEGGVFAGNEGGRESDQRGGEEQVGGEHGLERVQELGVGELVGLGGGEGFAGAEELVRELGGAGGGGETVDDIGGALGEVVERGVCGECGDGGCGCRCGGGICGRGDICGIHGRGGVHGHGGVLEQCS